MAKKRTTRKKTVVKKRWIRIKASKEFNETLIGESYLGSPEDAFGRIITASMSSLGGENAKQYIHISFKVTGKKDDALTTKMISYKFSPTVNKRFVRRRRSKLEDSFVVPTKDGVKVRLKPLVVTRTKAQGGVMAALKKEVREYLIIQLHRLTLDQFWQELLSHKLQKKMFDSMKKVVPLSACELRWVLLEGSGAVIPKEEVAEEKTEEKPEEVPAQEEAPVAPVEEAPAVEKPVVKAPVEEAPAVAEEPVAEV